MVRADPSMNGGGGEDDAVTSDSASDVSTPAADPHPKPSYAFPSVTLAQSPGYLTNAGSLGNVRFDQYVIKAKVAIYHNGVAYDVTKYLMEIKTHMALGEPSGQFTMLLTFQKRWDLLIQPQDYVEIRFGRFLAEPPVIMRGFVSNVRRSRIMDNSGMIHRGITINGENFGKIWNRYQIEYLIQEPGQKNAGSDNSKVDPQNMPSLLENYGIGIASGSISLRDLMQGITNQMLNAQIKYLQQVNPQIPLLTMHSNVSDEFQVNGMEIKQEEGSAYGLVQKYENAPWCEAFIDEGSAGPVFFYRNTPFKKEDGTYVWPESKPDSVYFPLISITDADILQEDLGHSDNEAYSYFATYPTQAATDDVSPKAEVSGTDALTYDSETNLQNITNPHLDVDNLYRYGMSLLQVNALPVSTTANNWQAQCLKMNRWLVDVFVWSQNMLNGTLTIKGNEHMRIGRYFTNTSTNEEYYIESVDHELVFSQTNSYGADNVVSFTSNVGFTRGRRKS